MLPPVVAARCGLAATIVLFCLALAVVLTGPKGGAAMAGRPEPGSPAAQFNLPSITAERVSLADLRGRIILLCVADPDALQPDSLAQLGGLYREFGDDRRVQSLTIFSTDARPGTIEALDLQTQLLSAGIDSPGLLDQGHDVSRKYRIDGAPTLFVIDAGGTIRSRETLESSDAPLALAGARRALESLLRDRTRVLGMIP